MKRVARSIPASNGKGAGAKSPWIADRFKWLGHVLRSEEFGFCVNSVASAIVNDFVSRETGEANLSWRVLASYLHTSEFTIRRAIAALEQAGLLTVERGCGRGSRAHRITLRMPSDPARSAQITGIRPAESRGEQHDYPAESRGEQHDYPAESRGDRSESRGEQHTPPRTPNIESSDPISIDARATAPAPTEGRIDHSEEVKRRAVRLWLDGCSPTGFAAATEERLRAMVASGECTAAEAERVAQVRGGGRCA